MPRGISPLVGRTAALSAERAELEAAIRRLRREEEYLVLQIRQAREQVRYYEGLLHLLKNDWGRAPGVRDMLRKLG